MVKAVSCSQMYKGQVTRVQVDKIVALVSQGKDWVEYSRLRFIAKQLISLTNGLPNNTASSFYSGPHYPSNEQDA